MISKAELVVGPFSLYGGLFINIKILVRDHREDNMSLKGDLNSSTYVPAQLTKDQLLVHHINTLTKISVKIIKCELPTFYWLPKLHKRPYKSRFQVTALLPFFLSILHLLLQLSKIMLWSTVKLLLAIVMWIIVGPLKTLLRFSRSCDSVTFRVLKYLLSTFLLLTPHYHMILSKQKCCLWSTFVSTESQNLTSVLHSGQDVLVTRNMTKGISHPVTEFYLVGSENS